MFRTGPAGNCDRFYAEGFKSSVQAPAWVADQGLNAYEYAAGHGVSLGEDTARQIGQEGAKRNLSISIHAPYYINCAALEEDKRTRSVGYLLQAARAVKWMGGSRVVFHVGSPGKRRREDALDQAARVILDARRTLDEEGLEDILLCPETMGRPSQLGTLQEILDFCALSDRLLPTIDFGHLHAAGQGAMRSEADFDAVLARMIERLGIARCRFFHAHFSRISYTAKGERMHMTFSDEDYGPRFEHLAPCLIRRGLEPTVICESRGTQADDALTMLRIYQSLSAGA